MKNKTEPETNLDKQYKELFGETIEQALAGGQDALEFDKQREREWIYNELYGTDHGSTRDLF